MVLLHFPLDVTEAHTHSSDHSTAVVVLEKLELDVEDVIKVSEGLDSNESDEAKDIAYNMHSTWASLWFEKRLNFPRNPRKLSIFYRSFLTLSEALHSTKTAPSQIARYMYNYDISYTI